MLRYGLFFFLSLFHFNSFAFSLQDLNALKPSFIKIPHGTIKYYRFGTGTPIVLINGYANNVSSWNRNLLVDLANAHTVIIFDNRGVGASVFQSKSYTSVDLANDVHALLQQLKAVKVNILGISMGGMIAQQYALLYPETVSHLILINTAIAGPKSIPPSNAVQAVLYHMPKNRIKQVVTGLKLLFPPGWRLRMGLALQRDHFKPHGQKEVPVSELIMQKQRDLVLGWSKNKLAGQALSTLNVPTLILSGGADEVIPPINSDVLLRTIPHASLLRWPQGGHAMIYQYPHEIAQAINQFARAPFCLVTDDVGQVVALSKMPSRIISLAPDITEILFALGASSELVGVIDGSDYPKEATNLPRVGNYLGVDLERIMSLHPDLIVTWHAAFTKQVQALKKLNIPIYTTQPQKLSDIPHTIKQLGCLTGYSQKANSLALKFNQVLAHLSQKYQQQKKVTVFYQLGGYGYLTINKQSWINQVISLCGGQNIFAQSPLITPEVTLEALYQANPEVILGSQKNNQWVQAWHDKPMIQAVKNHFIYNIDPDLIERAGPRLLVGAQLICQNLASARQFYSALERNQVK